MTGSNTYRILATLAVVLTVQAGCREQDGPLGGSQGQLIVSSDPEGGRIFLDEVDTGRTTPDTLDGIGGSHTVLVLLDSAGDTYSYAARVIVQGIEPFELSGPLTARCGSGANQGACYARYMRPVTASNMTASVNAIGAMLLQDGSGQGLLWPAGTTDTYVSNAMPLIAAKVEGRGVALGMYDIATLAGRPAPSFKNENGEVRTDQRTWIVPTTSSRTLTTIRGIEVREQWLFDASLPDVALVRLTYRNITNSPLYQKLDVRGTDLSTGITYDDVYLGFGMDPDIGGATDDIMSYDPELRAVFAYDADFDEPSFSGGAALAPGLVGVRMLSAPNGARVILNGYGTQGGSGSSSDWHAGTGDELTGWSILSGSAAYAPDDPDPNIGMLVPGQSDVRIMVSAGPYTLRPAEEISIVVAVALASPVPGSFTPKTFVAPGDPRNASRPIMNIAARLRSKLTDAATLLPKLTN